MKKLIAIDGNSLMHRAYYALPSMTAKDGTPTGAIYGFVGMLLKLLSYEPDYLLVAFDMHGPTFRHEQYGQYKAGRRETPEDLRAQFPLLKELLKEMGITICECIRYEADDILRKGVQSICELVTQEAEINVDFADVCAVMQGAGLAHMGVGSAKGKDKAEQAAKLAMSSPLLETNINGAKGIVINVTASPDIGLEEVDYAVAMITNEANPDATIIFGAAFDDSLEDEMRITLIATGFEGSKASDIRRPAATSADVRRPADQTADKPSAPVKEAEAGSEEDINNIIDMINRSRSDDKNLF